MEFKCQDQKSKETWGAKITELQRYESHYEMRIESRSSIVVVFGKTSLGGFACLPDYNVGCHIINLKDKFWNTEKLTYILGQVDGITVAKALYELSETIKI